jgi:hypothetical protein
MLGAPEEKEFLGHYAKEMAMRCLAQSRHLAESLLLTDDPTANDCFSHACGGALLEKMERATPFTLTTAISANWFKDIETQAWRARIRQGVVTAGEAHRSFDAQGLLGTFYCS